jgi:hypothetical protein
MEEEPEKEQLAKSPAESRLGSLPRELAPSVAVD